MSFVRSELGNRYYLEYVILTKTENIPTIQQKVGCMLTNHEVFRSEWRDLPSGSQMEEVITLFLRGLAT